MSDAVTAGGSPSKHGCCESFVGNSPAPRQLGFAGLSSSPRLVSTAGGESSGVPQAESATQSPKALAFDPISMASAYHARVESATLLMPSERRGQAFPFDDFVDD